MIKNLRVIFQKIVQTNGFVRFLNEDHFHHFKSSFRSSHVDKVDAYLETKSIRIPFSDYIESKALTTNCPIKNVHAIQLAANNQMEDRWNIGLTQVDGIVSSLVFAVLDGHSGPECSHALAWIALDYIGAAFLSTKRLQTVLQNLQDSGWDTPYHIARRLILSNYTGRIGHAVTPPPRDVKLFFQERLFKYIQELVNQSERSCDPRKTMIDTLTRIDSELCSVGYGEINSFIRTAQNPFLNDVSHDLLHVALSGSVGLFGHITWDHASGLIPEDVGELNDKKNTVNLHVANVGDCGAVLVSSDSTGNFIARKLNSAHQGNSNLNERIRLQNQHPDDDIQNVLRNGGRLLGELAPTRSFGDVRYKWSSKRLMELAEYFGTDYPILPESLMLMGPWSGLPVLPSPYNSPPYLTAEPEVTISELNANDRYLVFATDGLWDVVPTDQVASVLSNLSPDQCPATKLLRCALTTLPPHVKPPSSSRKESAADREGLKLASALLSLPPGMARYYRDDITIVVLDLSVNPIC